MNRLWSRPSSSCVICKILVESSRAETTGTRATDVGFGWLKKENKTCLL